MDIKINSATYYLLPLVELSISSFGDAGSINKQTRILTPTNKSNIVNVYLSTTNMIVVKVRDIDKVPSESLINSFYFTDYQIEEDGVVYSIILYRVNPKDLEELDKFRTGKYSKLREITKDKISIFNSWDKQPRQPLYGALYKADWLREQVEEDFGVTLSEEDEVRGLPSEDNFIDLSHSHKILQTIPNE